MTIINPIFNDKSEAGDRILWARFVSIYLHRNETKGGNNIRRERNMEMKKKERGRIMATYTQIKLENLNSILHQARMSSVTVYTFDE